MAMLIDLFLEKGGKYCDKWEQYFSIYQREFSRYVEQGRPVSMLEVGVQNGGSLELWAQYMPSGSTIIGIDINEKVGHLNFDNPQISVHVADATNASEVDAVLGEKAFEIIIDDGSHQSGDITSTFLILYGRLRPGGSYIIEDLHCSYSGEFEGGYRRPGSSMEWLKQFADVVNCDHIIGSEIEMETLYEFKDLARSMASVTFYDSVCVIEKLSAEKTRPYRRLINGEAGSVVPLIETLIERHPKYVYNTVLFGRTAVAQANVQQLAALQAQASTISTLEERLAWVRRESGELIEGYKQDAAQSALAVRGAQVEIDELRGQCRDYVALAAGHVRQIADLSARCEMFAAQELELAEMRKQCSRAADREQYYAAQGEACAQLKVEVAVLKVEASVLRSTAATQAQREKTVIDRLAFMTTRHAESSAKPGGMIISAQADEDIKVAQGVGFPSRTIAPRRWLRTRKAGSSTPSSSERQRLLSSPLFNSDWYRAAYPDVMTSPLEPIDHYLRLGAAEGRNPGPIFDTIWYLNLYEDVAERGINPLVHFLHNGWAEGRRAGPLFDPIWYQRQYPDVASAGLEALTHFVSGGMAEGRQPNPFFMPEWYAAAHPQRGCAAAQALFDYTSTGWLTGCDPSPFFSLKWYAKQNADIQKARIEPLRHFLAFGKKEKRRPSPFFDDGWYLATYPDVAAASIDPLDHFLDSGLNEGREPNGYFLPQWYASRYPDRVGAVGEAVADYTSRGWHDGCDPSPRFSAQSYLARHPEVADAGDEPLLHFLATAPEVRETPTRSTPSISLAYREAGQISAATLTELRESRVSNLDRFFSFKPMNIEVDRDLGRHPAVSIMLPGLNRRYATGGPNTAYILGCLLAAQGLSVNFISLDAPADTDLAPLKLHLKQISGIDVEQYDVRFLDAHNREMPFKIGYNDVLIATAWWTAHPASAAAGLLRNKEIYYLIQDYESLFYGLSTTHALARESYSLAHRPICNTSLLLDQLFDDEVGLYADREFVKRALSFDPSIDRKHFYVEPRRADAPRKLLFYTRPTMAERNLFGLGLAALRAAISAGVFDGSRWEFIAMGEDIDAIELGRGYELKPSPWLDFESYGKLMRSADILLSLMMSPHPSYPPLEMAACRGVAVTTTYGVKTVARLQELSENIIGVEPTIESLVEALVRARMRIEAQDDCAARPLQLPSSWPDALSRVIPQLVDQFQALGLFRAAPGQARKPDHDSSIGVPRWRTAFKPLEQATQDIRREDYRPSSADATCTLVTVLHSRDTSCIEEMASDLILQDAGEASRWIVVAGSTGSDLLEEWVRHYRRKTRLRIDVLRGEPTPIATARKVLELCDTRYIAFAAEGVRLSEDAVRIVCAFAEQSMLPDAFAVPQLRDWNESGELLRPYDRVRVAAGASVDMLPVIACHAAERLGWLETLLGDDRTATSLARCWNEQGVEPLDLVERLVAAPRSDARREAATRDRIHPAERSVKDDDVVAATSSAIVIKMLPLPEIVEVALLQERLDGIAEHIWLGLVDEEAEGVGQATLERCVKSLPVEDVRMLGSCVLQDGAVIESAFWFGDASIGSYGPYEPDAPQTVGATSARCAMVRADLLLHALPHLPARFGLSLLGPWLGALAQEQDWRVVLEPAARVTVGPGLQLGISKADALRFVLRFGDLGASKHGRPFRAATGRRGLNETSRHPWFSYRDVLEARTAASRERLREPRRHARVSILTTVYSGTDAALFEVTAQAVRNQIRSAGEWIVLAHGPISDVLRAVLDQLAADGSIRLYREPVNLGIHGGLRFCLERASQPFAVCLDADDVFTDDAIDIFDRALQKQPDGKIFYTDEDLLIQDRPVHAFLRPDYDPVHIRCHSFIWHSILFATAEARELGAFTSAATEYAQDWDLILRFELAGLIARHVRQVVYHWRQHQKSLSNSGQTFQGSLDSVKAALELVCSHGDHAGDMVVSPYPMEVGMPDFYLKRLPVHAPTISWYAMGTSTDGCSLPVSERCSVSLARGTSGWCDLLDHVRRSTSTLVLLTGPAITLWQDEYLWQAIRHFDLCSEVDFVGGVISRASGEVVSGPTVRLSPSHFADQMRGSSMLDRGTDQLSRLKAQAVAAVGVDLLLARRTALLDALEAAPAGIGLRSLGCWLSHFASVKGRVLAYEPLFRAMTRNPAALVADRDRGLDNTAVALAAAGWKADTDFMLRGIAGIARMGCIHER